MTTPVQPPPVDRFYANMDNLTIYIGQLVSNYFNRGIHTVKPEMVELTRKVLEQIDKRKIIDGFITYSFNYWEEIRSKHEDFFDKHLKDVFRDLPLDPVLAVRDLLMMKKGDVLVVSQGERDNIWFYFNSFCKISIKHIAEVRKTDNKFMEHINLEETAKLWEVKL